MRGCGTDKSSITNFRKSPYTVIISIITIWAFLFNIIGQELAWAANPYGSVLPATGTAAVGGSGQFLSEFVLSNQLGIVKETYQGPNGKTIIHIQDAHCNYSAQKNVREIVSYLNEKYGVNLATLEGGEGDYDLSVFTDIADLSVRERVADYFTKEGRINGVELYAVLNPDKVTLKGLEEARLYKKNLAVYQESLKHKDKIDTALKLIQHKIDKEKESTYSPKLKELDSKIQAYNNGKLEFKDYLEFLTKGPPTRLGEFDSTEPRRWAQPGKSTYPNLSQLIEVMGEEGEIDFKACQAEREKLIRRLKKVFSRKELVNLAKWATEFKNGTVDEDLFYLYILASAKASYIKVEKLYPNLIKFTRFLVKYGSLDNSKVFEELEKLEKDIFYSVSTSEKQRRLYDLSKDSDILNKFFSAHLSKENFEYYRENKHRFNRDPFKALNGYRDKFEQFYLLSFKRDDAFITRLNRYIEDRKTAILFTGGFHTDNLKELLKKHNYSYIVILPKFDPTEESPYFKLLSGGLTPAEEAVKERMSTLALTSPFTETDPNSKKVFEEAVRYQAAQEATGLHTSPADSQPEGEGGNPYKSPTNIGDSKLNLGWLGHVGHLIKLFAATAVLAIMPLLDPLIVVVPAAISLIVLIAVKIVAKKEGEPVEATVVMDNPDWPFTDHTSPTEQQSAPRTSPADGQEEVEESKSFSDRVQTFIHIAFSAGLLYASWKVFSTLFIVDTLERTMDRVFRVVVKDSVTAVDYYVSVFFGKILGMTAAFSCMIAFTVIGFAVLVGVLVFTVQTVKLAGFLSQTLLRPFVNKNQEKLAFSGLAKKAATGLLIIPGLPLALLTLCFFAPLSFLQKNYQFSLKGLLTLFTTINITLGLSLTSNPLIIKLINIDDFIKAASYFLIPPLYILYCYILSLLLVDSTERVFVDRAEITDAETPSTPTTFIDSDEIDLWEEEGPRTSPIGIMPQISRGDIIYTTYKSRNRGEVRKIKDLEGKWLTIERINTKGEDLGPARIHVDDLVGPHGRGEIYIASELVSIVNFNFLRPGPSEIDKNWSKHRKVGGHKTLYLAVGKDGKIIRSLPALGMQTPESLRRPLHIEIWIDFELSSGQINTGTLEHSLLRVDLSEKARNSIRLVARWYNKYRQDRKEPYFVPRSSPITTQDVISVEDLRTGEQVPMRVQGLSDILENLEEKNAVIAGLKEWLRLDPKDPHNPFIEDLIMKDLDILRYDADPGLTRMYFALRDFKVNGEDKVALEGLLKAYDRDDKTYITWWHIHPQNTKDSGRKRRFKGVGAQLLCSVLESEMKRWEEKGESAQKERFVFYIAALRELEAIGITRLFTEEGYSREELSAIIKKYQDKVSSEITPQSPALAIDLGTPLGQIQDTSPRTSPLLTSEFPEEQDKNQARDIVDQFEEGLKEKLSEISWKDIFNEVYFACHEALLNTMMYGEGGTLELNLIDDPSGRRKLAVVITDNGEPGLTEPDYKLQESIDAHIKLRGEDMLTDDFPEQKLGLRNIVILPDIVFVEEGGRRWAKTGRRLRLDEDYDEMERIEGELRLEIEGESDVMEGTRITLAWLEGKRTSPLASIPALLAAGMEHMSAIEQILIYGLLGAMIVGTIVMYILKVYAIPSDHLHQLIAGLYGRIKDESSIVVLETEVPFVFEPGTNPVNLANQAVLNARKIALKNNLGNEGSVRAQKVARELAYLVGSGRGGTITMQSVQKLDKENTKINGVRFMGRDSGPAIHDPNIFLPYGNRGMPLDLLVNGTKSFWTFIRHASGMYLKNAGKCFMLSNYGVFKYAGPSLGRGREFTITVLDDHGRTSPLDSELEDVQLFNKLQSLPFLEAINPLIGLYFSCDYNTSSLLRLAIENHIEKFTGPDSRKLPEKHKRALFSALEANKEPYSETLLRRLQTGKLNAVVLGPLEPDQLKSIISSHQEYCINIVSFEGKRLLVISRGLESGVYPIDFLAAILEQIGHTHHKGVVVNDLSEEDRDEAKKAFDGTKYGRSIQHFMVKITPSDGEILLRVCTTGDIWGLMKEYDSESIPELQRMGVVKAHGIRSSPLTEEPLEYTFRAPIRNNWLDAKPQIPPFVSGDGAFLELSKFRREELDPKLKEISWKGPYKPIIASLTKWIPVLIGRAGGKVRFDLTQNADGTRKLTLAVTRNKIDLIEDDDGTVLPVIRNDSEELERVSWQEHRTSPAQPEDGRSSPAAEEGRAVPFSVIYNMLRQSSKDRHIKKYLIDNKETRITRRAWREENLDVDAVLKNAESVIGVNEIYEHALKLRADPNLPRPNEYAEKAIEYSKKPGKGTPSLLVLIMADGKYDILEGSIDLVAAKLRGDRSIKAYIADARIPLTRIEGIGGTVIIDFFEEWRINLDVIVGRIVSELKEGRPVVLDLRNMPQAEPGDKKPKIHGFAVFKWMVDKLAQAMNAKFRKGYEYNDISYSVTEVIKNAFVHGNKLNPELPIVIRAELDDEDGQMVLFEVYDTNQQGKLSKEDLKQAGKLGARITGWRRGIKNLPDFFTYKLEEGVIKDRWELGLKTRATLRMKTSPAQPEDGRNSPVTETKAKDDPSYLSTFYEHSKKIKRIIAGFKTRYNYIDGLAVNKILKFALENAVFNALEAGEEHVSVMGIEVDNEIIFSIQNQTSYRLPPAINGEIFNSESKPPVILEEERSGEGTRGAGAVEIISRLSDVYTGEVDIAAHPTVKWYEQDSSVIFELRIPLMKPAAVLTQEAVVSISPAQPDIRTSVAELVVVDQRAEGYRELLTRLIDAIRRIAGEMEKGELRAFLKNALDVLAERVRTFININPPTPFGLNMVKEQAEEAKKTQTQA